MIEHAVLIAGGGPTGLMLAGELAIAGIDVAIVERRATQAIVGTRAGGLHSRTIETLDQRGIADRFLSEGQTAQVAGFAWFPLSISDFPTRHNYGLALTQNHIERILADWVRELNVPMYREREVAGLTQADGHVDVALSNGDAMRARFLVGCDGGRSVVRKTAGIEFPGWDPSTSQLIAEVQMAEDPPLGLHRDVFGIHAFNKLDAGRVRVMVTEQQVGRTGEPMLRDLSETLTTVFGSDFGVRNPAWISRFTDMTRQAAVYRQDRIVLAGDAAHIHYPSGGQGLNIGMQDAVNLGWKLAQVVNATSPESLLDTYHAERHPVAARVLHNTLAQVALLRTDDRTNALRGIMSELLQMDQPRRYLAGMLSGLDVHYDFGEGHPLLGRRMPDLDLMTRSGGTRVYNLLHKARPVFISFGAAVSNEIAPWSPRVRLLEATYDGAWELPVIGAVTAPSAVLIRPDGYVAWVGDGTQAGLVDALTRWCGPA